MANMLKFLIIGLFISCFSNAADPYPSQTVKNVEQRLLELEQRQKELEQWYSEYYLQSKGRVSPFLGEGISIGGYFESAITNLHGPDMKNQTVANTQIIGLNITAEYSEKIRFVAQTLTGLAIPLQNPHNNPNLTPSQRSYAAFSFGSLVAQGYVEFAQSESVIIQSGIGYVPFGQAYQQREPVLFHQRGGPQMISSGDMRNISIANPLWSGLNVHGRFPVSDIRVGYNVYTFTPFVNETSLGVGGRLWFAPTENSTMGISVQSGKQKESTFFSHGIDVDLKFNRIGTTVEYAYANISGDGNSDTEAYYFEPYYKLYDGEYLVYVNADYLHNPMRTAGAAAVRDPIKKWQYGVGINWLPLTYARFRLSYIRHDYTDETDSIDGQRRDFNSIDFSTAIAF